MPPVGRSGRKPREGDQRSGDACTDHRRLRSNRQHVGADRGERSDLPEPARKAEQPGERKRPAGDEHDVLARHREQVVETRSSESLPQVVRERLLVAEDDPFDDPAPLSPQPGRDRAREPSTQAVGDAAEPTAPTDLSPAISSQNHVHAVSPKPGRLVEAVLRRLRQTHRDDGLDQGTLRRRAPERQLELDGLAQAQTAEASDLGRHPQLEPGMTGRPGDRQHASLRGVDVSEQHAAIERIQSGAAPPPTEQRERSEQDQEARFRRERQDRERCESDEREHGRAANQVRAAEAEAERRRVHVRRAAQNAHGTTRSRSCSSRFGPIPGTASSSSTDWKAPCFCR